LILRQKIFVSILFFGLANINLSFSQTYNFDSLKKTISENKGTEREIDLLVEISENYKANNIDTALYYILLAIEKAKSIEYSKGYINSLHTLSSIFLFKNDYKNAFKYAEQSLIESQKSKNKELIGISKTHIAVIYAESGNFTLSTKYNFEALKIFEQIENKLKIETIYGNIGADYISQKDYKKALEYLFLALDIAIEIEDTIGIAYQYNNIGAVYYSHFKDKQKALYYFREALKINIKQQNDYLQGINYVNICSVYKDFEDFDSAVSYNNLAYEMFSKIKSNMLISNCLEIYGEIYILKGDSQKAILYFEKAFDLAHKNNYYKMIQKSAELLHKSYISFNDTVKAYKFLLIEKNAQDKLNNNSNKQEIAKIEFQYNLEKERTQKELLQKRKNLYTVIIFTLLVFIILIIIILFYKQKIKTNKINFEKQKIESELSIKNNELSINLMAIFKKNEIKSDIVNKLVKHEQNLKEEKTKKEISKIIKEIDTGYNEKIWNEFSTRFQEVHIGFYEKLLSKFPDLTQGELRLCAFLVLNMSSKEISDITGQQISTLENARYRLRKKLGITNLEINLVGFLSQI